MVPTKATDWRLCARCGAKGAVIKSDTGRTLCEECDAIEEGQRWAARMLAMFAAEGQAENGGKSGD